MGRTKSYAQWDEPPNTEFLAKYVYHLLVTTKEKQHRLPQKYPEVPETGTWPEPKERAVLFRI